jgi:curved DNA-binding protein CbpA
MDSEQRPHPSAEGTFDKTPFAHVLLYIRERALDGTLSIDGPADGPLAGEHFFVFERGALAQSWIASGIDRIGDLLCEGGTIPESKIQDAEVVLAAAPQLVGELYLEMELIEPDAIPTALREQNRRRALRMFELADASYRFYQGTDLLHGFGSDRFTVDPLAIVWRGVCAAPPRAKLDPLIGSLGRTQIQLREDAQLDAFEFESDAQPLLSLLRLGPASLAELEAAAPDPALAHLLVYVLLTSKQAVPLKRPSTRPRSAASPPPIPPSAGGSTGERASLSDQAQVEQAEAMLAAMDEQTFFEMLGVPTDAPDAAIRQAFLKLATKWHPDRVASPRVKDAYQRVFALFNEAHQTLSNPKSRERYARVARDGGGTPAAQRKIEAMLEADNLAQRAEFHLKRKEMVDAERLAREAMALSDEDPAVLATLGAVLLELNTPKSLDEAITVLVKSVEISPNSDHAHMLLGLGYKRRGDAAKALHHFQRAAEINPKNVEAAREVRLAFSQGTGTGNRPAVRPGQPGAGTADKDGLLNKIFKR